MKLTCTSVLLAALGVGASHAADLPMVTKAPAKVVESTWTGLYIGAYGGYGWANTGFFDTVNVVDDGSHVARGGMAGGTLGVNYQTGVWVLGIEADGGWADIKGGNVAPSAPFVTGHAKIDALATITGRAGFASGRTLFYVKGGGAWASRTVEPFLTATGATLATGKDDRWGWVVGAGVEHMFAPNWSAKVEYNFIDLGNHNVVVAGPNSNSIEALRQEVQTVKAGINYRFASWPPR